MMSKNDKAPAAQPAQPVQPSGCAVCGLYGGKFIDVTATARAHESCAAERPDVVAKVKARA